MSIGFLAIGFAVLCCPVALYGMAQETESHQQPPADYSGIYRAMIPRDL